MNEDIKKEEKDDEETLNEINNALNKFESLQKDKVEQQLDDLAFKINSDILDITPQCSGSSNYNINTNTISGTLASIWSASYISIDSMTDNYSVYRKSNNVLKDMFAIINHIKDNEFIIVDFDNCSSKFIYTSDHELISGCDTAVYDSVKYIKEEIIKDNTKGILNFFDFIYFLYKNKISLSDLKIPDDLSAAMYNQFKSSIKRVPTLQLFVEYKCNIEDIFSILVSEYGSMRDENPNA